MKNLILSVMVCGGLVGCSTAESLKAPPFKSYIPAGTTGSGVLVHAVRAPIDSSSHEVGVATIELDQGFKDLAQVSFQAQCSGDLVTRRASCLLTRVFWKTSSGLLGSAPVSGWVFGPEGRATISGQIVNQGKRLSIPSRTRVDVFLKRGFDTDYGGMGSVGEKKS